MTLSIVIVNWNTREHLLRALASLHDAPAAVAHEVIVVDNASEDGSADEVTLRYPSVCLIRNRENTGYACANNQGLRRASGDFLLLLNPDVIVPPGALDAALGVIGAESDIGALGIKLVSPDGSVQRSVRGFPTPQAVLSDAVGLSWLFPRSRKLAAYRMPWFDYDTQADVDQPMGTFLLMRLETVEEVGLLDEGFPIFFNEVDWCYRAKGAGWRVVYTPRAQIVHYGGASTRQVAAAMAWESRTGLLTFFRKHYPGLRYLPIYVAAWVSSWLYTWFVSRIRVTAS